MVLTAKGQITIPQDVREQLDLRPGDSIVFVAEGDKLVGYPLRKRDGLRDAAGTLGNGVKYAEGSRARSDRALRHRSRAAQAPRPAE